MTAMKDSLTPDIITAVFALVQNHPFLCSALLFVAGVWALYKLCTAITELVKLFKPSK